MTCTCDASKLHSHACPVLLSTGPCNCHPRHELTCAFFGRSNLDPVENELIHGKTEAIRVSHPLRYDILDPAFLEALARIADYGAKKYGDFNWQKSRLSGDKGPINHIYKHLKSYRLNEPYDHPEIGTDRGMHLAAIAFNALMEFYYCTHEDKYPTSNS
jgi:hypothetical protein